ncbi:MAG: hypothetical protein ACLQPD_19695 [Desulfomonilaceae bacterium]
MKGFNVAEIFCELLSGFAAIFLVIVLLDVFGTSCLRQSLTLIVSKGSATAIAGAVLVAYLVGLVVDAVGLAVGGWFLDSWLCQEPSSDEKEKDGFLVCKESEPSPEEVARFWTKVPRHVLAYRDHQWAYVSAYRNLLILAVFIGFFLCWPLCRSLGCVGVLYSVLGTLVLELVLCKSVSLLLKLYYKITKTEWQ